MLRMGMLCHLGGKVSTAVSEALWGWVNRLWLKNRSLILYIYLGLSIGSLVCTGVTQPALMGVFCWWHKGASLIVCCLALTFQNQHTMMSSLLSGTAITRDAGSSGYCLFPCFLTETKASECAADRFLSFPSENVWISAFLFGEKAEIWNHCLWLKLTLLSPHIKTFDVFKQELLKVPYFARRITFLCFRTVIRVSRCLYMSVNSGEITKTSSFKKSAWYSFYPAALSLSLTSCPSDVWKVQKTLISGKTKGFWRWL